MNNYLLVFIVIVGGCTMTSNELRAEWTRTNGPYGGMIYSLAVSGTTLFAGAGDGLFRSTNNGTNWIKIGLANTKVTALAVSGVHLYAGTAGAVHHSTNNGVSWTEGQVGSPVNAIAVAGTKIFAGTDAGIFVSTDNAAQWTSINTAARPVRAFAVSGTTIIAATGDGIYRSADNGATWEKTYILLQPMYCLAFSGSILYAGGYNGVYQSTDNGTNWTSVGYGLPYSYGTWLFDRMYVYALVVSGTKLIAATRYGVYRYGDNGQQWTFLNYGGYFHPSMALVYAGKNLLVGGTDGAALSTDDGAAWTEINSGILTTTQVIAVASSGMNLFAVTTRGAFYSSDDGSHWQPAWTYFQTDHWGSPNSVNYLAASGSGLYAGMGGVCRSVDNGKTWVDLGYAANGYALCIAVSGTSIFVGTRTGISRTTDSGATWTDVSTGMDPGHAVTALAVSGTTIYAGTEGYRFYSSENNGDTWTNLGLPANTFVALAASGSDLFAWEPYRHFIHSSNKGVDWYAEDISWTASNVTSLTVSGKFLVAGSKADGIWRRPLAEIIAGGNPTPAAPAIFSLEQNYPNPFNPGTTISFALPSAQFVSLQIFDVMGRDVSTIVSEELPAGTHTRRWDASDRPSGVYFYRLRAGSYSQTKRMTVTK